MAEVWESAGQWEGFRDDSLIPFAKEIQAPPFDTEIEEMHNKIVSEKVLA